MEGRLVHSEVEWASLVSGSYSGLGFSQYKRDSGREIQMATKKQKREAAMARREAYLAEVKADGLKALESDRRFRDAEKSRVEAEIQAERTDPFLRGGTTLPVENDQNYMDQARNFARYMYIGSTD